MNYECNLYYLTSSYLIEKLARNSMFKIPIPDADAYSNEN